MKRRLEPKKIIIAAAGAGLILVFLSVVLDFISESFSSFISAIGLSILLLALLMWLITAMFSMPKNV